MRWGSERRWRFWRSSCFILDRIWSRRSSRCLWCGSVVCCSVRVMLLNAIKEMRTGKGASVNAVFTYVRATYGYDLLKNRGHIKKMLAKLINEGIVDRVKGKCESDTRDVPRMDELPEERGIASRTDSQNETETPTRASVVPFNTLDYRFECICGELGIIDYKARVQCMNCQLWQHADCVNYKEESLTTTPFYCPHCLVAMKPVSTGATLIISPSSICHQWVEEINHHIRSSSLRVLGVKRHGFIQPHMLAEQDVVITTYDVLRSELNYVDIPHSNSRGGRRFRNQKRYMAVPSPLVAVEWWRICLDEAQMVECPTAKVNQHPVPLLNGFTSCLCQPMVRQWHSRPKRLRRKISDWSLKLGSLDRRTVNTILYPLLRLRQACCHPQAVRGDTMTMEELLKSLQKKCRVECEEAHRQLAEQLRQHYMTKYDSEVADAHQALQPVLQNIKELKRKVNLNSPWWLEVIQRATRCSTDEDLVSRVKNELTQSYKQQCHKLSMADKYSVSCGKLAFIVGTTH
ncbi:hypothetical protein GOODEAATRI_011781 [Goodea atripinnis]|uniref:Uncharacterized protein n=1 Tax=Goodea atripinnis TaxID=208336 RepID=A0ABV0MRB1_9TELE